jgi:hypothetical protein
MYAAAGCSGDGAELPAQYAALAAVVECVSGKHAAISFGSSATCGDTVAAKSGVCTPFEDEGSFKATCKDGYIEFAGYGAADCSGTATDSLPHALVDGGECLAFAAAEEAGHEAEEEAASGSVDGEDSALAVKTAAAAVAAAVAAVAVLA